MGGVLEATGFGSLNGTQLEGLPTSSNFESPVSNYSEVDGKLSTYSVHMHHGSEGPRYCETRNKQPTSIYPQGANGKQTSNATFRFSFGLALLDDGYYGQHNRFAPDPWYDEYSVDVESGSPNFGRAVRSTPSNESLVRRHKHWMGYPLGPRYRIYDAASFAPGRSLVTIGTFDANIQGWSGNNVNVSRDTSAGNHLDGSGALRASNQLQGGSSWDSAKITGPTVSLTKGEEYTLVFSAKATEHRRIRSSVGGITEKFSIAPAWTRRVMTFTASKTGNFLFIFVSIY